MAAYVIVSYDVVDPEGFAGYVPGVMPVLAKHGAEVLVADSGAQAAPLKKLRLKTTANGNFVIAKAFAPPGA